MGPKAAKAAGESKRGREVTTKIHQVTPALAKILGKDSCTRPDCLKGIWDYIKANKLQSTTEKRMIVADSALQAVVGEKEFKHTSIMSAISRNIIKAD